MNYAGPPSAFIPGGTKFGTSVPATGRYVPAIAGAFAGDVCQLCFSDCQTIYKAILRKCAASTIAFTSNRRNIADALRSSV